MGNLLQKQSLVAMLFLGGLSTSALADNVTVTTAAELEAAIKSGNVITVKGNIKLDNVINIKNISNLTIEEGTFNGQNKTALFDIENSDVTFDGTVFKNALRKQVNEEEVRGGAIRVRNGKLTVLDSEFENNAVEATNKEENFYGGGAINADGTELNIDGAYFAGNTGYHGGAIMLRNCKGLIQNCDFEENSAFPNVRPITDDVVRGGGAILVRWEGDKNNDRALTIFKCNFTDNSAKRYGGAIVFWAGGGDKDNEQVDNHVFTVQSCSFVGNSTLITDEDGISKDCGGGAISVSPGRPVTINIFTSTFYNNRTRNNGGAIDFRDEADTGCRAKGNIVNCTIVGNTISNDGGGNGGGLRMRTYPRDGQPTLDFSLINTVIAGNKSKKDAPGDNLNNSDFRLQVETLPQYARIENNVIRDLNDRANATAPTLRSDVVIQNNFWNADQGVPDPNVNRLFTNSDAEFGDDGNVVPDGLFDESLRIFWLAENSENHVLLLAESGAPVDEYANSFGIYTDQLGNELQRNYVGAFTMLYGENEDGYLNEDIDKPYLPTGIQTVATNSAAKANGAIYTLSGVRVAKAAAKGVYIQNGKKIVVGK